MLLQALWGNSPKKAFKLNNNVLFYTVKKTDQHTSNKDVEALPEKKLSVRMNNLEN